MSWKLTQFGDCHCVMFSTTTFVALPMVRGTGRENARVEAPAVPESYTVSINTANIRHGCASAYSSDIESIVPNLAVTINGTSSVEMDVISGEEPKRRSSGISA